ncbi:MAG: FAD-dependent oxidoreductase [Clostridia bacterium]|nr:FAD-dependent oxidoreductase [Clostridia bacterium]
MNKYYPNLFSPIRVGRVTLKNRIGMSAMDTCYFAKDGSLTPKAIAHYLERAKGGVGLIVTEISSVNFPYGRQGRREARFNDPNITTEWAELIQKVHSFGTKILAQIGEAGFIAFPEINYGRTPYTAYADASAVSAEASPAKTITLEEIEELKKMVRECAKNIASCDFDGLEFHAAHDYLLNEFLSPITNKRTDQYGGSTENRARLLIECIQIAREELGPNRIISLKFASCEEAEGGLTLEEGGKIAKMCEDAGADLIDCSVGQGPDGNATEAEWMPDGRRIHFAEAIKKYVDKAVIGAVGKLRDPQMCEDAIASGKTDMVFLARQLLCDPFWAKKAEMGQTDQIRKCLSCREGCFAAFRPKSGSIRCVINPYQGFEEQVTEHAPGKAADPKDILIVGGGISGMQAAIIAKKRGHKVSLVEKTDKLGGQMQLAGLPPHKQAILEAKDWFIAELGRVGVTPELNTTITKEDILARKPDVVLLAIGSEPSRPPVPGIECAEDGWDVLRDIEHLPENKEIVIIGGGTVGCEIAHTLIEKNNHISIIEMLPGLSLKQNLVHRQHNQQVLDAANTNICINSMVKEVAADKVVYSDKEGALHTIECDMVICASGQRPKDTSMLTELRAEGIDAYSLGDATATGDFRSATRSAMDIVMAL